MVRIFNFGINKGKTPMASSGTTKLKYFLPFLLWFGFSFYLLFMKVPLPPEGIKIPGLDKIAHLLIFGGFGFFLIGALAKWRKAPRSAYYVSLFAVAIYGVASELFQTFFTHHRSGEWYDLLADIIGGILATFFYPVFQDFIQRSSLLQKYFF